MFISTGFTQHHNVSTGNYFSLKTQCFFNFLPRPRTYEFVTSKVNLLKMNPRKACWATFQASFEGVCHCILPSSRFPARVTRPLPPSFCVTSGSTAGGGSTAGCAHFRRFQIVFGSKKNHFFHRTIAPVRQRGTKNTPFTEETQQIAAEIDLFKRSHEVQRARNPGYTCMQQKRIIQKSSRNRPTAACGETSGKTKHQKTSVQVRVFAGAGSPESTKFAMDGV